MSKYLFSLMGLVLLLASCGQASDQPFGRSYDECVLRNATRGGDVESRDSALEICQRRFERAPTADELRSFELGSSIRLDQPYFGDDLLVTVRNNSRNLVVTEIQTDVVFMDRPRLANGKWPADAKPVVGLVWNLNPAAQPLESGRAIGTFDDNKAPSPHAIRRSKVTRVLPLQ